MKNLAQFIYEAIPFKPLRLKDLSRGLSVDRADFPAPAFPRLL